MKITQILPVILLTAACAWSQARPQTAASAALEGMDPVLLTEGKETPGQESLTLKHGRFTYQFTSEETRERFRKDPEKYGIQLDGACARMGPPTGGSKDAYFVYENRIYVFGGNDCYKRFSASPEKYLESKQPKEPWNPTPSAVKQGQALLKKAIDAMGGTAKWEAVRSYLETRHRDTPRGTQVMTIAVRWPDSYRNETTQGEMTFGGLITPAGKYNVFRGEGVAVPESFGPAMLAEWRRDLLSLLLARNAKGFEVYYAGRAGEADLLAVNNQGALSTLVLDPTTGQITAIKSRGRNADGFGEARIAYSDYRETGGLRLPFRAEGTFAGDPSPGRSWVVDSYQFNPPDLDAKFQVKIVERQ